MTSFLLSSHRQKVEMFQPRVKLEFVRRYCAPKIGQIVRTASHLPKGWRCHLMVVVYGDKIARHLLRAKVLEKLDIAALHLEDQQRADRWLFGASWMDGSRG